MSVAGSGVAPRLLGSATENLGSHGEAVKIVEDRMTFAKMLFSDLHDLRCVALFILSWALGGFCQAASTTTVITYPRPESATDSRYEFDWVILRTALEKSQAKYGPFELRPNESFMPPARVIYDMEDIRGSLDVFVRATSNELEQKFLPIRIPIDRGLLGYRVFLTRKDQLLRFSRVRNLEDLRDITIGQGKGWTDVRILSEAGFKVVEGSSYEGLFAMLSAERFDAFSRAFEEALPEYEQRKNSYPNLVVEPEVLLVYPLARYFFVRRSAEGASLAKRIEFGLESMIQDGSYMALFKSYKQSLIRQAGLTQRRIIRIPNPNLSPETPLSRHELWYDPTTDK